MKSSARQTLVWVFFIACAVANAQSQSSLTRKGSPSSISGKVTMKGKGVAGIVVGLRVNDSPGPQTSRYRSVTDQDGNYRITNVPRGNYQVVPAPLGFVLLGEMAAKTLLITEGETVEGIDFALVRGSVITGRVTDSDGRPLIEEQIKLLPVEGTNQLDQSYMVAQVNTRTDDRGIYRAFGLRQGRYKVSVGQGEDGFYGGVRGSRYKQTFHPAVTDPAKATVIEATEGSEATNVDITVGRTLAGFAVSGRIIDG
jgi:hypothetical protein